jgi:hypothetical protein
MIQSVISGFVVLMVTIFVSRSAIAYFDKKKREKQLADKQKIEDEYFGLRIFPTLNIGEDDREHKTSVLSKQNSHCGDRFDKTLSMDVEIPMENMLNRSVDSQKTPECSETSWSSESHVTEASVEHEYTTKRTRSRRRRTMEDIARQMESLNAAAHMHNFDEEPPNEFDNYSNKSASRYPNTELHQRGNDTTTVLFAMNGDTMPSDLPKAIEKPRSRIIGELVSLPL